MERKIIQTENAPAPIGPYNQAVLVNGMLFISGQVAINPQSGELYQQGNIKIETEIVMQNLKAILTAAGMDFSQVAKSSIFLKDMTQFAQVNEVYGKYFTEKDAPARETIQVAALPKGACVEISMIAIK